MNTGSNQQVAQYAAHLANELAALPAEQRTLVVEGVEEHIWEALDEGRDLDEVLAALGTPREAAAEFGRDLGVPSPLEAARRARRALSIFAVAVGVLTAVSIPVFPGDLGAAGLGVTTLGSLVPVVLAALPLVLPHRAGGVMTLATAVLVTLVAVFGSVGVLSDVYALMQTEFLLPLAFALWAAAIVPAVVGSTMGSKGRTALRVAGGVLIAAPSAVLLSLDLPGSVDGSSPVVLAVNLAILAIGVMFAVGIRVGYALTAVVGLLGLIGILFDPGLLFLLFWAAGGLWLALGVGALVGSRRGLRPAKASRFAAGP